METTTVDPNIENYLKQDLGNNNKRIKVDDQEFSDEDSEDSPVSSKTKNGLARIFVQNASSEVNAAKIMSVLNRLENMTESQAARMLEALKLSEFAGLSDEFVSTIVEISAGLTVHPKRPDIIQKIMRDKHIKRSFSLLCGDILDMLGSTAGVVTFVFYSILSYYGEAVPETKYNAKAPVQDDGVGAIANGENDPYNKTT